LPPESHGENGTESPTVGEESHHKLAGPFRLYRFKLFTLLGSIIFLTWAVIYVLAFSVLPSPFYAIIPPSGYSGSLILVRVATEAAGILLNMYCDQTLDALFWTRASSKDGVTMPSFLSISPSTHLSGLWDLWGWPTMNRNVKNAVAVSKFRKIVREYLLEPALKIVGILFFPFQDLYNGLRHLAFRSKASRSSESAYPSYHHSWITLRYFLFYLC